MSSPDRDAWSVDAFWHGAFHLVQPRRGGYRSGLDALLVAACVDATWGGQALDMGAGAGAIGFAAACRAPGLAVTLAESAPDMAACARAALALEANKGICGRVAVTQVDLLCARAGREAAGLADGAFDHVLSNPPFYPPGHRPSPLPLRRQALSMPDDGFMIRWLRVAGALSRHGATLACVVPPDALALMLAGLDGRFGAIAVLPVHGRADAPATRLLLGARRGSRAPLRMLPALALADETSLPTGQAAALAAGTLQLNV